MWRFLFILLAITGLPSGASTLDDCQKELGLLHAGAANFLPKEIFAELPALQLRLEQLLEGLQGHENAPAMVLLGLREAVSDNERLVDRAYEFGRSHAKQSDRESRKRNFQQADRELNAAEALHDLRNLLMGISSLKAAYPGLDSEKPIPVTRVAAAPLRAQLKSALVGLARARQIVADLEAGKPLEVKPEVVSARTLFREIQDISHTFPKGIEFSWEAPVDLPAVKADTLAISRVLMNLCTNAVQAMPNGGKIRLRADVVTASAFESDGEHDGQIRLGKFNVQAEKQVPSPPGTYLRLSVSDTGPGIDPKVLPHIFSPGFTTRRATRGQGLGLSSAINVVDEHGGMLAARSQLGQGTEFRVLLPVHSEQPVKDPIPEELGEETVIIADDIDSNHLYPKVAIAKNWPSLSLHSGNAVVQAALAHPGKIKAVLLDKQMPGFTFEETVRELQEAAPGIRIIVISADETDGANVPGVFASLKKPPDPVRLRALLSEP